MTLAAASLLGFFLGVRHATDADHVVAITTIICRQPDPRGAVMVGVLWGVGHTLTMLLVGSAIILFHLAIPTRVADAMELSVAAMLILLGVVNLKSAIRPRRRDPVETHAHAHAFRFGPHLDLGTRLRPLAIGIVHGLAGSAAIALLVLTTIRDTLRAMLYLGVFGAGTVLGMMMLTLAMTLPIALAARRFGSLERIMAGATGAISVAFGLFLILHHGVAA